MKINIPQTKTIFISINDEKTEAMNKKLSEAGFSDFSRFDGFVADQKITGCATSHRDVLKPLRKHSSPFIILEDDAQIINMVTEIEIPDDADALYLGTSKVGFYNGRDNPVISVEKIDDNISRIYNMLSAHAILYITPEYTENYIRTTETCIDLNIPHDIGRAETMKYFNVYCLNSPMFSQEGPYESYTNKSLGQIKTTDKFHANMLERKRFR
jgi:hypothetical protein